jgi:hypothetical protein
MKAESINEEGKFFFLSSLQHSLIMRRSHSIPGVDAYGEEEKE